MRILIDLQGAQNDSKNRGIGRYCLALAKAIIKNKGKHEVFILLNGLFPENIDEIKQIFYSLLPEHNIIIFNSAGPVDELLEDNLWRTQIAELMRENFINNLNPDVILISSLIEGACDNTVTSVGRLYSNIPSAVILYDLIPFIDPEKYIGHAPSAKWYYQKIDSLKRADVLLGISASAKIEAVEHLDVNLKNVVNISSAADDNLFYKKTDNELIKNTSYLNKKYNINRKYLMHSSAFDPRKNFKGLIQAFALLPTQIRDDYQLVLVCKLKSEERQELNEIALKSGINRDSLILTNFVSDDDLVILYSNCYLFIFPSFSEGFGLPALEAMCCGTPAIGSNTTSIPEVIGRKDALFNPHSIESIAHLIEKVLTNIVFWESLKQHALDHSKKFSWNYTAKVTIKALEDVVNKRRLESSEYLNNDSLKLITENINSPIQPTEQDITSTAIAISENERAINRLKASADFCGQLIWRIEGPFDSSYSLALLNRETARAMEELGHFVVLHSTEGPGDFLPNQQYLDENTDLARMNSRVKEYPHDKVDVTSRNLYPPRVEGMTSTINLLHHYAWEESGFPTEWVNNFNENLNGITCLSNHINKIMIDNGVSVPLLTSGCGVDHWERVIPVNNYQVKAKSFRFLHVSSCFPRKGADLMLDAYGDAFTVNDEVTLVVKTFKNPHNEIHHWLAERKQQNFLYPDVLIIEEDLSDEELKALYQECHVLVAPSKAEGFGLPMAEAMLCGLPVITTAWGGQLDFCNKANSWLVDYQFERAKTHFELFISVWAKIDIYELTRVMKEAFNTSRKDLHAKAYSGRIMLLKEFKWIDCTARAVNAVYQWRNKYNNSPNVKIGWLTTWNTKCGIATYSEHLINNMQSDVTVFAPHTDKLIKEDATNCMRFWNTGKTIEQPNNFNGVSKEIIRRSLNTIIIQFNYGFYNFDELSDFVINQVNNGITIIIMMHSTSDPSDLYNWRLKDLSTMLQLCDRILVHSVADLNRLKNIDIIDNVALFPHGILNYKNEKIQEKNEIPLIASYGFCLPHKGLIELVDAVGILKNQGYLVRLRLVNAEFPDPCSSELIEKLKTHILKLKVSELVELHTDFLSDNESLSLLSDADLLIFAYQNTDESSSAAVRYGMATQRAVAVTPLSIFEDLGNAVFRFSGISPQYIADGIIECLNDQRTNSEQAQQIQIQAQRWRCGHDYKAVGKRLFNMCTALLRQKPAVVYQFNGSSPQIKTEVGKVQGKNLISIGVAGYLMYGPYLSLSAGEYVVCMYGEIEGNIADVYMDITTNSGENVLAHSFLKPSSEGNYLVSIIIKLDVFCNDLEVRVVINSEVNILISTLEIKAI